MEAWCPFRLSFQLYTFSPELITGKQIKNMYEHLSRRVKIFVCLLKLVHNFLPVFTRMLLQESIFSKAIYFHTKAKIRTKLFKYLSSGLFDD